MPTTVQFRRGTTAQNDNFTGAVGEISVDTTVDQLRVHDGATQGGFKVARQVDVDAIETNVGQKLGATATVTLTGDVTGEASFSSNAVSVTTDISSTGTPTGTFGSGSLVPVITVGADGRITNISNTSVAGVADFVYTSANNTFVISTADGGEFSATIDDLQEVSDALANLANTNAYIASVASDLDTQEAKQASDLANTNAYIASVASDLDTQEAKQASDLANTNAYIADVFSDLTTNLGQKLGATASVTITGDVAGSGSFSSNSVSIAVTQQNNSVDLGTHTTGNYVATISGTANEIEVSGSGSETAAVTVGLPNDVTLTGDLTVSGGDITLGGTGRIQGVDTVSSGTDAANKTYVDTAVAGIVDSAPAALDTLNELAAALGDDANFATTVATNLGQKLGATATVTLTGDITGTASFSSNSVSIATTYNNDVVLGTDTSGNYVGTLAVGTGIYSSGASSGEGVAHTLILDLPALTDMTQTMVGSDEFIVLDASNGLANRRKAASEIGLSIFNNDSGFSTTTGTVTSHTVSAGDGLTGGGTVTSSGTTTVNVGAGTLIDVTADAVNVDLSELTTSTSDGDGDFFVVVDAANAQKKLTKGNINISGFNNDSGFSTTTGTVTSVNLTAGSLIDVSGGPVTTSGSITVNVDLSELTDMTAGMVSTDEFVLLDGGAQRRKAANEITLDVFGGNNWETKTTNFNVAKNGHYFADVRTSGFVATLPSSPSVGDEFRIVVIGDAQTNNLKLSRNGERIQGELSNLVVTTANAGFGLVYASSNTGWRLLEV